MNEMEMNSNLRLKIQMDEEVICGQKINVKIISKSNFDMILNNLSIDVFMSKDMFRFIKKNFKSDIFKVKVEKIDDNNVVKLSFKLKKQINLCKDQEEELINFDVNVKKKVSSNESDIIFKIKIDDNDEEFIKHVLVESNLKKSSNSKIKNISAKSDFKDQKIQFDENVKNYKITVPHDQQYINFELCESFDDSENIKSKCIKLRKEGSSTVVKIGDYKIEVCRLNNPEKTKKTKKTKRVKKAKKSKNKKISQKTKKNIKTKNSNNEIKEILNSDGDEENDEIDVLDDLGEKTNNNISSVKEEKINTENNNNSKILIGSCIVSLILIGVCGFLWKKRKNKN